MHSGMEGGMNESYAAWIECWRQWADLRLTSRRRNRVALCSSGRMMLAGGWMSRGGFTSSIVSV